MKCKSGPFPFLSFHTDSTDTIFPISALLSSSSSLSLSLNQRPFICYKKETECPPSPHRIHAQVVSCFPRYSKRKLKGLRIQLRLCPICMNTWMFAPNFFLSLHFIICFFFSLSRRFCSSQNFNNGMHFVCVLYMLLVMGKQERSRKYEFCFLLDV